MLAGLKGAIFSKSGLIGLVITFIGALATAASVKMGEDPTAGILAILGGAFGVALRHTAQKIMELVKKTNGDST